MASASALASSSASSSASVDGEGDHDDAGDPPTRGVDSTTASGPSDGERDRTRANGGERTTGADGVSIVAEGNGEGNNLGDGVSLGDGNVDLRGLKVAATSANTNPGCAIGPTSTEPLKEGGL